MFREGLTQSNVPLLRTRTYTDGVSHRYCNSAVACRPAVSESIGYRSKVAISLAAGLTACFRTSPHAIPVKVEEDFSPVDCVQKGLL